MPRGPPSSEPPHTATPTPSQPPRTIANEEPAPVGHLHQTWDATWLRGPWRCSSVHALWRRPISSVSIWTGRWTGGGYTYRGAAGVRHCAGHDLHRSGSTPRWPPSSTPPRGDTRGEGVPDGQPIDGHRQPGPGTAPPPVPGAGPAARRGRLPPGAAGLERDGGPAAGGHRPLRQP